MSLFAVRPRLLDEYLVRLDGVRQTNPRRHYERSRNMCYPSCMLATKQKVRDLLERLPDDCSLDGGTITSR